MVIIFMTILRNHWILSFQQEGKGSLCEGKKTDRRMQMQWTLTKHFRTN